MKEELEDFLGEEVEVGVPHWDDPDRLFFYIGFARDVTDKFLVLSTETQLLKIDLNKIRVVKIHRVEK